MDTLIINKRTSVIIQGVNTSKTFDAIIIDSTAYCPKTPLKCVLLFFTKYGPHTNDTKKTIEHKFFFAPADHYINGMHVSVLHTNELTPLPLPILQTLRCVYEAIRLLMFRENSDLPKIIHALTAVSFNTATITKAIDTKADAIVKYLENTTPVVAPLFVPTPARKDPAPKHCGDIDTSLITNKKLYQSHRPEGATSVWELFTPTRHNVPGCTLGQYSPQTFGNLYSNKHNP